MLPSNQIYLTSFCATLTNNTSNLITWPNIDILKFGQIRQTIEEQIKSLTDELYSMLHINILRKKIIFNLNVNSICKKSFSRIRNFLTLKVTEIPVPRAFTYLLLFAHKYKGKGLKITIILLPISFNESYVDAEKQVFFKNALEN